MSGINANFKCHLSLENLYDFYVKLIDCYKNLQGSATLSDYSQKLTNITIYFEKIGKCLVQGLMQTNIYSKNSVGFGIECDQTYIKPIIKSLEALFDQRIKMQGNSLFY